MRFPTRRTAIEAATPGSGPRARGHV